MSAQLAGDAGTSNSFHARLALAAGVTVAITAPTLADLSAVVAKLQPTVAANDAPAPRGQTHQQAAADHIPGVKNREGDPAGNASASTGTQASALPAASGSAAGGEDKRFNYDDIKDRVLKLAKLSRDTAVGLLKEFKGVNGQPVDNANKLQLQDYSAFVAKADEILAKGAAK